MKVDFQKLKSLFDPEEWDIGILTEEYYEECMNSPIKAVSHPYGIDMTENPVSSYISAYGKDIKSFLVLVKLHSTSVRMEVHFTKMCWADQVHSALTQI